MFKNKKYLTLTAGFTVIIGLMLALGIISLQKASNLSDLTTKLYDHPLTVSNAVLEVDSNIISMHRYMKDVSLAKNKAELDLAIQHVNNNEKEILRLFDIILERFLGDSSRITNARDVFINWASIRSEVIALTQAGKFDEASAITKNKGAKYVSLMTTQMKGLVEFARNKASEFLKNSEQQSKDFRNMMLWLITGVIGISIGVVLVILSSVNRADEKQIAAENELRLAKKDLEDKVKKRTAELSRKNKEIMLQKQMLEDIGHMAKIGGWEIDIESNRLTWTPETYLIHEVPDDFEPNIETAIQFYSPESQPIIEEAVKTAMQDGTPWDLELTLITAKGQKINVRAMGEVVYLDGKITQLFGTFQNITEQKLVMNELEQAKIEADDANQAKSNFLSSMSHELRTPMNAILGFAQVLILNKKEPLTEHQESSIQQILKGGEHLLDLINDVLNLAKIESGKLDLNFDQISSRDVLDECLPLMSNLTTLLNIKIETQQFTDAIVYVDRLRFKQVLFNLLSNAIKYNRKKGQVNVSSLITGDNMYRISVTDTGKGISPEKQAELFKPFSRLGAENSDIEGTGIGLTITKRLVEAMNGDINFKSIAGEGSTFWVDFPLSTQNLDTKQTSLETSKHIVNVDPIKGTILYVEDNPANANLMETVIRNMNGVQLEIVGDAEMGVATAIQTKPDLILMDINLPGMSGIEALAHLQRNEKTQNIPVIAISADVLPSEINKAMQAGFLDYLTKPINVTELINKVSAVMQNKVS